MSTAPLHAPDWERATEAAPWQARDSHGRAVFDGHMWVLGGWFTPHVPNPRDVWKSADGAQWSCTAAQAPWVHGDLPAVLAHGGRLWLMGGRRLPGKENSNRVWSSVDGADWVLEGEAAWCPRVGHAHAVFRDRMWVLGGTEDFYEDNDATLKSDVWSSADGRSWSLETDRAGWSPRRDAQAVVFDDRLWIVGGGHWRPETVPRNDVWCSGDGRTWTRVTDAAPWRPRIWHSVVAYRGRLWVLGGWSRVDGNYDDVWCSEDGRDWQRVQSSRIWRPRHAQSAYVFEDRIWIAGGHAEPLDSEVWSLRLPAAWPVGQTPP